MTITPFNNADIDLIWHRIKDYVQGAADYTYGRFTANDIRSRCKSQNQQLWIAHNGEEVYGFVITQMSDYPQLRALIMHFTGGKELPLWKDDMLKALQEFARNNGCDIIESYGRGGWAKVFKNDGFESKFMFYELPVETV